MSNTSTANGTSRPSVLLITMDELHREALSFYGARSHATPNVDRLLREGVNFTNAYTASPYCLPSRVSMATGLYPHSSRSYSNNVGASMDQGLPNLFSVLRDAGYVTSKHGKCHFVPVPYRQVSPHFTREYRHFHTYYKSLGMDHLDLQDGNAVSAWFYDDYALDLERVGLMETYREFVHGGRGTEEFNRFLFPGPEELHPDSWVGRKAMEYLDSVDPNGDYFMWVSFSGPHYPLNTPEEYLSRVQMGKDSPRHVREGDLEDETKANWSSWNGPNGSEGSGSAPDGAQKHFSEEYWRSWRHMYYANVVQIDDYIGRIVDSARERFGDDLLVIFTCDHGDMIGNHGIWGKNQCFYDDVLHVPLGLQLPHGAIPDGTMTGDNGRSFDGLVSLVDLFPTILEAAGVEIPECDGIPLQRQITERGRDHILSEGEAILSVVTRDGGKWTRERRKSGNPRIDGRVYHELYDLRADPFEFENLYGKPEAEPLRTKMETLVQNLQDEESVLDVLFFDEDSGETPPWMPNA